MLAFLGGVPVMGIAPLDAGLLFFLGEINGIQGIQGVPQRLVTNLVSFMLSGATRADRCRGPESPPGAVINLVGSVSGSTLTLTWAPPSTGGLVTSYVIEAGVSPGDSSLASFDTGTSLTSFVAGFVPSGTYFIRVKARNSAGFGPASNELVIQVGSTCQAPAPPASLNASVVARTITLTWTSPAGAVTDYVVEAGSSPGLSNLANFSTGSSATSLTASAPPGTYFVRVRARNGCGTSPPSNETAIVVQ
jgi:titin